MPTATLLATVKVNTELLDPGAGMVDGLKPAVTPEGRPLADKAMAPLNPPEMAGVMVVVPLAPCCTVTVVGFAESEKVGLVEKVKHCVRLPVAELPSRGGNAAPLVELFVRGVLVSNV